jgi:hypothetical protein
MKHLLVAVAATATVAIANPLEILKLQQQLPACSIECIEDGAAQHDCTVADLACQCKNMEPIIKTVSPCLVHDGCGLEEIART